MRWRFLALVGGATALMVGTMTAYFFTIDRGVRAEAIGPAFADTPIARAGWRAFARAGCTNCHSIMGQLGQPTGTDLTRAGARGWTESMLRTFLSDPQRFFPGTLMPRFDRLHPEDLDALVKYVASLK